MESASRDRLEAPLRTALAERLGESRFGLWFGEGVSLGVSGDAVEVGVPNAFFRDWIAGHFARNLVEAAHEVTGRQLRLAFRLDDEAPPPIGHVVDPVPFPDARPTTKPAPKAPTPERPKGLAKAKAPDARPSSRSPPPPVAPRDAWTTSSPAPATAWPSPRRRRWPPRWAGDSTRW